METLSNHVIPVKPKSDLLSPLDLRGEKLTLIKKSKLVRVSIEEINAIRPSAYKYLLP